MPFLLERHFGSGLFQFEDQPQPTSHAHQNAQAHWFLYLPLDIDPRVCMHHAQSHKPLSLEPEFFQWNNSKESGNKITAHVMCAETEWGALEKYQ